MYIFCLCRVCYNLYKSIVFRRDSYVIRSARTSTRSIGIRAHPGHRGCFGHRCCFYLWWWCGENVQQRYRNHLSKFLLPQPARQRSRMGCWAQPIPPFAGLCQPALPNNRSLSATIEARKITKTEHTPTKKSQAGSFLLDRLCPQQVCLKEKQEWRRDGTLTGIFSLKTSNLSRDVWTGN